MRPADRAWLALAVGVTCYEVAACARRWELLSTALDRWRAINRPVRVAVNAVIGYFALHLTRAIPARADPLSRLADRLSRSK